MRKILLLFCVLFLSCGLIVSAKNTNKCHINFTKTKVLVAYFSYSGNTKQVAELIQTKTGGDIYEIKSAKGYPSNKKLLSEIAKFQINNNIHPELKDSVDVTPYKVIFIGTPVWYGTLPPPVETFLSQNNLKGKIIIPFITHGGGGKYDITVDIDDLTDGKVIHEPFVVCGKGDNNLEHNLNTWLKLFK